MCRTSVELILKLRAEIDADIGLADYLATYGPPPPIEEMPLPEANGHPAPTSHAEPAA
jgi:hypothetical protein